MNKNRAARFSKNLRCWKNGKSLAGWCAALQIQGRAFAFRPGKSFHRPQGQSSCRSHPLHSHPVIPNQCSTLCAFLPEKRRSCQMYCGDLEQDL